MDQNYLQELIDEAKARGGGLILNSGEKPAVVVMTIERYNQLLSRLPEMAEAVQPVFGKMLVTGGAGYVGSEVARQLLLAGYEVVVVDNLSSGRLENIPQGARFLEGSIGDANFLRDVFAAENFYAVFHCAEASGTSGGNIANELLESNVLWTQNLLTVMLEAGVKRLVFSSTAEVYGQQETLPISESAKLSPVNAYGYSKLLAERLVKYHCHFLGLQSVVFRYAVACGSAFPGVYSAREGFLERAVAVAQGQEPYISVWGSAFPSNDGTPSRDYVHVADVAAAHVLGLKALESGEVGKYDIYNIGCGRGYSMKELLAQIAEISNKIVPMEMAGVRPEIASALVLDCSKISQELGFSPRQSDIATIIQSLWKEVQNLPM